MLLMKAISCIISEATNKYWLTLIGWSVFIYTKIIFISSSTNLIFQEFSGIIYKRVISMVIIARIKEPLAKQAALMYNLLRKVDRTRSSDLPSVKLILQKK